MYGQPSGEYIYGARRSRHETAAQSPVRMPWRQRLLFDLSGILVAFSHISVA